MAYILDENGSPVLDEAGMWVYDEWGAPFPDAPLDLRVEVNAGGTWQDLSHRLDHGNVVIGRGHPDESVTVAPSTVEMELTNSDGALSPDNPQSPLWPYLVQNIPGRVSIAEGASYMRLERDQASGAGSLGTIAAPADMDIQADVTLDNGWTQGAMLAAAWNSSGNDRCWLFAVNWDGTLQFSFTSNGLMGTYQGAPSTLPVSAPPSGRMSARVTWNHTTGTATFWTSVTPVNAIPSWVQLGAPVTLTPASPFAFASAINLGISGDTNFSTAYQPYSAAWPFSLPSWPGMLGKYHGFRLLNGSTVLAAPDFTGLSAGMLLFTDSAGVHWSLFGTAEISSRNYRGHFEMSEWPQDEPPYNPPGGTIDATVKVKGGGLLRRLSQRNRPVDSAVARGCRALTVSPGLAAAWMMEDSAGAASIASLTGGLAMTWTGTPALASSTAFAGAGALPVLNGAQFTGRVKMPYAPGWTDNVTRLLVQVPQAGETTGAVIASMRTSGTVARADLTYDGLGRIGLSLYSPAGALLASTGSLLPFGTGGVNGQLCRLGINLQASGGNILYWIEALRADGTGAQTSASASIAGSIGAVLEVALNAGGLLLNTVIGGITVQPLYTTISDMGGPLAGWAREPAGWRQYRLCAEEGIPFRGRGDLAATTLMGVQSPQTLAALMQQCADADMGIWTELRQALGWGYVTRRALYNQAAMVQVSYLLDHLSPWASPPQRDDLPIVNDVTYTNASGSSARQFAAAGQPIPGGRFATGTPGGATVSAGTYDQSYSVAIAQDADLNNLAGWKLHLGTADQTRFPGILLDLANRALGGQADAILAMDLGHRAVIASPPLRWGTGSVSQLAQQLTETLGAYELEIAVTGVPELPYQVFQLGSSHIDTDGTTLQSSVSSSARSLGFVTAAGFALWTTAPADFPFDVMISGERMTVTNITGSSSPQAATVIRSVNGVVKAQAAGAQVNVWPPPVIGL